ncbi:hypothetical protein D3C72_1757750 [compost metagenome]
MQHPGIHLAGIEAERNGRAQCERGVLAIEVVGHAVRHFHGALLHAVHHAEGRHQLATGVHGDFKLAARHGLDGLGEHISAAVNGVQRLGEAGSQAPANGCLGVDGRRNACSQHASDASLLDD